MWNLSALLRGCVHLHLPLLQEVLQVQIENIDALLGKVDTIDPVKTCVCATADVIVGQRGAAQLWDDILDPAIYRSADQIDLVAVHWVAPHPSREDIGPHKDALWEDAPHRRQVLLDGG